MLEAGRGWTLHSLMPFNNNVNVASLQHPLIVMIYGDGVVVINRLNKF